jgi:hypothetical protein
LLLTTEHQNNQPKSPKHCVQHKRTTVPPSGGRINRLLTYEVLAKDRTALRVTFEESTQAGWLHEVVRAYVTDVIVCDPRRNKLLEDG